ncbi:MAG: translocation/assembly module TamB domain-containing protein [Polyangia bacterium]
MTTVETPPATQKRRNPLVTALRVVAYVILATVVVLTNVVVGLFFYAKTNRAREQALRIAMKQLQPIFPGGAKLGSSEGDLTEGLVLHDLVLDDLDGRPAVKVDKLELRYSLLALISTRVQVDLLGVDGVTVIQQPLADGRDNLATMAKLDKPLPKTPSVLPVSVVVDALDVDARFVQLAADGSIDHVPHDHDVRAKLHARLDLSHGMVATVETLTVDTASPVVAKLHVTGAVHITDDPKKMDLRHILARVEGDATQLRRHVEKLELRGPVLVVATANGTLEDLATTVALDTKSPKVRLRGNAHVFRSHVVLHELTVKSPFADVDARGSYHFNKTGEGKVKVDVSDFRPFELFGAPPMQGSMKLGASAKREDGHVTAQIDGLVKNFGIAKNRIGKVVIDVAMTDLDGHALVTADDAVLGSIQLKVIKAKIDGGPKGVVVGVAAQGPEGVHIELGAGAQPKMENKKVTGLAATLDRFVLKAGGTPWMLDRQVKIEADFKKQAYSMSPLGLNNYKQHATLEGKYAGDEMRDVHVDIEHFDLSQLPALLSPGHALPHTDLKITADASGPLDRPDAGFAFEGVGDGRSDHDLIRLHASGDGRLKGGRLNAKVFATIGGQKVSAKTDMPMPLRPDQPIEMSLDASVLLNAWFADLLVPKVIQTQPILMYTLGAKVTAQARVSGTTSNPKINGSARCARWGTVNSHGDLGLSFEYADKKLGVESTLSLSELPLGGGSAAGVVQLTSSLPIDLAPMMSGEDGDAFDTAAEWAATLNLKHVDIQKLPWDGLGIVPIVGHGWIDANAQLSGTDEHPKANVHFDAQGLDVAGVVGVGVLGDARLDGNATTAEMKVSIQNSPALHIQGSIAADRNAKATDRNAWRNAPMAATVTMPGFDLARMQIFRAMDGNVVGDATITGTWTHPQVTAKVRVDRLRSGETDYKRFAMSGVGVDGSYKMDVDALQTEGSSLKGHLDLAVTGGPISGFIDASHFKVDLQSDLVPTLRSMHGDFDGKVSIAGTLEKPKLGGNLTIAKGQLATAKTAITYHDLTANLVFDGDGFSVKGLKMGAGSFGTLEGDGHVALRQLHPDVVAATVALKKYPVEWDTTTAFADATLNVQGKYDLRDGGFDTVVTIEHARVDIQDDHAIGGLIPVTHLDDVKVGKARPDAIDGPIPPRTGAKHGRHYLVTFKGPFAVHGAEIDAEAHADIKVDLSSQIPTSSGVLELAPRGVLRLFGQTYDLEHAKILFGNTAQPNLDLRFGHNVPNARIGVDIGGSSRQPTTTFWSVPTGIYSPGKVAALMTGQKETKDGTVVKKGLDEKVSGAISHLIAVSFRQSAPASKTVDVEKKQPIADPGKNKQ